MELFIYLHGRLVEETGIPGGNHRPSAENLYTKHSPVFQSLFRNTRTF